MSVINEFKEKATVNKLCRMVELAESSYHYHSNGKKPGQSASLSTLLADGREISNDQVVAEIRSILSEPYICYGYIKIHARLRQNNYLINKKKVYRLMDVNNLLLGKIIKTSGKRQFVKHRKIVATYAMEYLCLDIKYVQVHGESTNYFLLSIMDIYSRRILQWIFQKSIRKADVIKMFQRINLHYSIKGVNVRNDNGSQFIANDLRAFLIQMGVNQEFTHIATPEENGYIEAFHSVIQKELFNRYEFDNFLQAKICIHEYMDVYNYKRILGKKLCFQTPLQRWDQGLALSPVKQPIAQARTGLSRPDSEGLWEESAPYSLDKFGLAGYLCLTGDHANEEKSQLINENPLQENGG